MALASSRPTQASRASSRSRSSGTRNTPAAAVSRARPPKQRQTQAAAAAAAPTDSSKYAICRLGGVQQMLQEGLLYTCPKLVLEQQQQAPQEQQPHGQEPRSYVLSSVLGLHNGIQFTWGSPYLANACVEVELVEEFQGPKPTTGLAVVSASSASAAAGANASSTTAVDMSTMAIYRVKAIRAAGQ